MGSLLHECMNKTGYDQATVENVLNSLFKILEQKSVPGAKIDFGEYAETFVLLRKEKKTSRRITGNMGFESRMPVLIGSSPVKSTAIYEACPL